MMQSMLTLNWLVRKFTVWNTLSFQPNLGIKWIKDYTKKSSLKFWIFKAVLRKVFLLCRLFCWTCFSWSFRHCLSGINRLNHCWDSWWIQKREKSQNIQISLKHLCTGQLKTDILLCMCKNLKKEKDIYSLKHLSAYEGFKFPLLFHTLTQTVDESFFFFQIVWMLKGRWWCFCIKPKKREMRKKKREEVHTCSCCCRLVISAMRSSRVLLVLSISCLWAERRKRMSCSLPSNWDFLSF